MNNTINSIAIQKAFELITKKLRFVEQNLNNQNETTLNTFNNIKEALILVYIEFLKTPSKITTEFTINYFNILEKISRAYSEKNSKEFKNIINNFSKISQK